MDPRATAEVSTISAPTPKDMSAATHNRWVASRQRARMVEGTWQTDAEEAVHTAMRSSERADHYAQNVDLSKCLLRDVNVQTAVLHDRDPVLSAADADGLGRFRSVLARAQLWPLMQTAQVMIDAQREGLVRVEVIEDQTAPEGSTRLNFRQVRADLLDTDGYENPDDPTEILGFEEWRPRTVDNRLQWFRDVLDVRDPLRPRYQVLDADGVDASDRFLVSPAGVSGRMVGADYPFRLSDGRPVMPGSFYHARKTSKTWDPHFGVELVSATLMAAVYWTFWGHCVLDSSWPQRAGIDVQPAGGVRTNTDSASPRVARIVTDPNVLLLFRSTGGKAGTLFQFDPAASPKTLGEAIQAYMQNALSGWGIAPDSAQRVSNTRSGYAISLSNAAKRDAQRKSAQTYEAADLRLLQVAAALWNRWGTGEHAGKVPETGLTLEYRGVPLSAEEERMEIERWKVLAELGVKSRVDLLARVEGITREEAKTRLAQIQQDESLYGADKGSLGAIPLALQQIALARERALSAGDTALAASLGGKMAALTTSF